MKLLGLYLKKYWSDVTIATGAMVVIAFATLWQPKLL